VFNSSAASPLTRVPWCLHTRYPFKILAYSWPQPIYSLGGQKSVNSRKRYKLLYGLSGVGEQLKLKTTVGVLTFQ
jgi:hypothetical protein